MPAAEFLFILVAGVGGGLAGSIAGLASLATYPALLAIGLPPVTANVTNTVSLVFTTVGGVVGSRPELKGQRPQLAALTPVALLGGAVGAALLLTTPAGAFEKVVPVLLGLASLTILLPRRRRPAGTAEVTGVTGGRLRPSAGQAVLLFLITVYGGYFGAAAGVLVMALLLHTTNATLPNANAAKIVLLGIANSVAAVAFIVLAPVQWSAVVPLSIGCLLGSRVGPIVVRRAPAAPLRVVIGVAGFALAVKLAVGAW